MNPDLCGFDDFTRNYILDYKPTTILKFPGLTDGTPAALQGLGTGTPQIIDVNTSGIGGMTFVANTDAHGFSFTLPYWMDPDAACGVRLKWLKVQAAAAGTGAALWTFTYNAARMGVTAMAIGATALNTPIANQVDLAQYVPQWTQMGIFNAGTFSALTPGDDAIDCLIEMTTLDTITDGTLIEAEFWARPRLL